MYLKYDGGTFFKANDNSAIILNYLFGYKIVKNRVGFPVNALNKVRNGLSLNKISYVIESNNSNDEYDEIVTTNYNCYDKILNKALNNYNYNAKINSLIIKINELDNTRLNSLLNLIGDFLDE